MKKLIFQVVLPLTLFSFGTVTKWWFGLAVDAKHVFFYGFPFIYKCEGFHTSGSTQYFLLPLLSNLGFYFLFWLIVIGLVNLLFGIKVNKWLVRTFWILCSVYFLTSLYFAVSFDHQYIWNRDFDVQIYETGIDVFFNGPRNIVPFLEKYT